MLSLSVELTLDCFLVVVFHSSADDEDSLDLPSFLEVMGRQNQAQTGQTAVGKCDQLLASLNHSVVIQCVSRHNPGSTSIIMLEA